MQQKKRETIEKYIFLFSEKEYDRREKKGYTLTGVLGVLRGYP